MKELQQLVNEVRRFIGTDHQRASFVLGFIMGVMADEPEVTVKATIERFLKEIVHTTVQ
jgi:hypothetical protein